jgi:hypothetical protein
VQKNRRALVIYGGGHLFRAGQSLVSRLERIGAKVFTITAAMSTTFEAVSALQPDVTSWPAPTLALIRGTALDVRQLKYYDAVLYLGPPSSITYSRLSRERCADPAYVTMRLDRLARVGFASHMQRFAKECAEVMQRED